MGTTVSQPGGSGAPVIILIASPANTGAEATAPAGKLGDEDGAAAPSNQPGSSGKISDD